MVHLDEDEDCFFESIGRIRRRADESRSPSPNDRGERRRSIESGNKHFLLPHTHQESSSSTNQQHREQDAHANPARPSKHSHGGGLPFEPATSATRQRPHAIEFPTPATNQHIAGQIASGGLSGHRCLKVKEPIDHEDLTEDEFEQYQARYGVRHKISASQILRGMSDQDAEDPTLGNSRTQTRLSEDGTIDRRDFDSEGGFRYSQTRDRGAADACGRRRRPIDDVGAQN